VSATGGDGAAAGDLGRLEERCTFVRHHILDSAFSGGSGHLGPALSCVEVIVSLYYGYMEIDPADPGRRDRDRFIMSKGHASSALYPVLADLGFFPPSDLDEVLQLGSHLGDHPNMAKNPGVDFSSGSLGHGLAAAAGMAEAARLAGVDCRVVVLLGDGELNEGQIWETAMYASARGLSNLLVIVDRNEVQVDGRIEEILDTGSIEDKWSSFGWAAESLDGHDVGALRAAYGRYDERRAEADAAPTALIAETVSGRGIPFIEGMAEWHVGFLAGEDYERARAGIDAMYRGRS
jgi:transketolase